MHDPEKCERFSDKIMRKSKNAEHDPFRKKRIVLYERIMARLVRKLGILPQVGVSGL
jgi:hypothetical protein